MAGLEIKQGAPSVPISSSVPRVAAQLWDCRQHLRTRLASSKLTRLKLLGSREEKRTHQDLGVSGAKIKTALGYPTTTICRVDPPGPSSEVWWLLISSMSLLDLRWPGPGS